ncbi:MAG: hypothetical protein A2849_00370 [Candidatus Taylorbacteria bacterium RIFCSPHIGHO2_01_FULL_51_15]|uniref:Uncharacterized protein n=1 Tax=Candidatus Taylorbacteria bacterium RIFCSPHIGHO2_01_FULL_51_15 TaxID=1802304 RepID=A0A1G2MDJ4_9BACT|nr:MAG: hypothetical protein A2849_00370 [Candidatus Taylorbacteria bacterium RIFCSPHIGHO2_01_FULL_51_15]
MNEVTMSISNVPSIQDHTKKYSSQKSRSEATMIFEDAPTLRRGAQLFRSEATYPSQSLGMI